MPFEHVIDCDVHLMVPNIYVLLPYLPEAWHLTIRETAFKGPIDRSYPPGAATSMRPDLQGAGPIDLDLIRREVLDPWQADWAILNCDYAIDGIRNVFAAAAVASAVNDWQREAWLQQEPRLRGSIVVPIQDPDLAAREIARVGADPGFVQVQLPVHAEALYGNRRYYPVFEAATAFDLTIGMQFGGNPGSPPTAVGWPSFYIEEYVGASHIFQSQLISMVTGGVFERFPTLRVVLLESGVTWLPSLLWRLDKEWKGLRREVPWVRRLPSEYIREHVRLTTAPFDAPGDDSALGEIIAHLGGDAMLLYASDFPHAHGGRYPEDWLKQLSTRQRENILRANAEAFYRFDRESQATSTAANEHVSIGSGGDHGHHAP
jgi:predicted TIM-barrel fold metal-dependent hydrolase